MEWQVTIDDKIEAIDLPEGSTANDLVNYLNSALIATIANIMLSISFVCKRHVSTKSKENILLISICLKI